MSLHVLHRIPPLPNIRLANPTATMLGYAMSFEVDGRRKGHPTHLAERIFVRHVEVTASGQEATPVNDGLQAL